MKKRIYCDYNATTPVIPAVKKAYIKALDVYGNASSLHETGRMAKEALENSRMAVASFINALPEQLLFCSSGTEANNQVLQQLIAQQRDVRKQGDLFWPVAVRHLRQCRADRNDDFR